MHLTHHFFSDVKHNAVRSIAFLVTTILLILTLSSMTPVASAHSLSAHSGGGAAIYIHTATAANSAGDYTMLDNSGLNGFPNAIIIVTPNWNPFGFGGTFDDHPLGVFYSGGHWYIFHQDYTAIPVGAAYNIYGAQNSSDLGYEGAFVHTATTANSAGDYTCIDRPSLNGQPTMRMLATSNWNPGGVGGVYNNHPTGVFYNTLNNRWCIFNQNGTAIPNGAAFNVNFASTIVGSVAIQTATTANSAGDYTCIDNASSNSNPKALLEITSNWNPGGVGGVFDNHNTGVFYNTSLARWCIFNQDGTAIPNGAAFNVYFFQA